MRTSKKFQVLTTGRVDQNGNRIPPDIIEWDMYDSNPVLLYDKKYEGHNGVVVGRVIERKRLGDGWVGKLSFMERFDDAEIAYEKYTQGVLPHVSIGGFAVGETKDGVFTAMRYRVREFSLVKFPANIDAKTLDASVLTIEDKNIISNLSVEGKEVRYLTMSADVTFEQMAELNAEENVETTVEASTEETTEENVETTVEASTEETTEENVETTVEASTEENVETTVEASTEENVETTVEASTEENVETNASSESPLPNGMSWHEQHSNTNLKSQFEMKTFKELNCDVDFQKKLRMLSAALGNGAPRVDNLPENVETIQLLASSMLGDKDMVILASRTNFTDAVSQRRSNALEVLINAAAGNATDATLAAADLGVIKYLSLFYEKLLANDTFRRSLRFVPMSDKAGAIYIEDAVAAPTYVGINTPINAPLYTYEDTKRTIARRVFSFNPILFQHSELAILSYDKQSTGLQSTMGQLMQDISTYWLQIIANTAGIVKQGTSGANISAAGLFPIEAPLSTLTIKKPTLEDIIALEGKFLMQNYNFGESGKYVELVMPSNMYTMLAGDSEVRNQLTRELNANIASMINFSATRITPRNPVARYNTTTPAFELDPALYADKSVANDGTFADITPATTTTAHTAAGIAFVKDEVLAGVGAIELIVAPSPTNYGTVISGWISTGCTVARSGGVGAAGLVPTIGA